MAEVEYFSQGERLDSMLQMAAAHMKTTVWNLRWSSWIHSFGTTAGPKKGVIAGQAFTDLRVFGFENAVTGKKEKFCANIWKDWDGVPGGW